MEPEFTTVVQATTGGAASTGGSLVVPTANVAGILRLFHGTDLDTASWIVQNGLSFERMAEYCERYGIAPGCFWATSKLRIACSYAHMNSAVLANGAAPAVLGFAVPATVVTELLSSAPPLAEQWSLEDADYAFRPESFATVNAVMVERTAVLEAEVKFGD